MEQVDEDDDIIPLAPAAMHDWLRLHITARQDVNRILLSVMDLFRPQIGGLSGYPAASRPTGRGPHHAEGASSPTLDRCFIASGSLDISVQTGKRAWPTGGVLPLLVDRAKQAPAVAAADGEV
jgi:hypothetical protein